MSKSLCAVIFYLLCLSFADAPTNLAHAAPAKKYHCWKIEQTNMLWGDTTIYACPQALKVLFKNGKWMNLAKGPDWQLNILNPTEKIYCTTSLDKWKCNLIQPGSVTDLAKLNQTQTDDHTLICGVPTLKIGLESKSGHKDWALRTLGTVSYWVARDIKLPDQEYHIMCGNAGLPNLHAVPLRTRSTSHLSAPIDTTEIKRVDVPANFFDMPSGYKFTSKATDVMNAGMDDIIKDMGSP